MTRFVFLLLAYFFLGLAVVGVFLPGVPTVPFLLLAAWFSAKGSERLHRWLYEHPHLGKLLIDWETQGAISRSSKVVSVVVLTASWIVVCRHFNSMWIVVSITLLLMAIAAFLLSRPEPH